MPDPHEKTGEARLIMNMLLQDSKEPASLCRFIPSYLQEGNVKLGRH